MNAEQIKGMLNAEYGKAVKQKEHENVDFVKSADIIICIKVDNDFDRYSVAECIEYTLDENMAVKDMIIFTK